MQITIALRAMWHALVAPWRVSEANEARPVAVFAVAVLFVAVLATTMTLAEVGNVPQQHVEGNVDLSSPQRHVTAALGFLLMITTVQILALSGLFLVLCRFLTDENYTFGRTLIAVSAASVIKIVGIGVDTILHVVFHSTRAGMNAGVFVDPTSHPILYPVLVQVDLFDCWRYIVIGIALTTGAGLHRRFGYVVGLIVWIVAFLLLAGAALVNGILTL